jgi:hypothetical protein
MRHTPPGFRVFKFDRVVSSRKIRVSPSRSVTTAVRTGRTQK